MSPKRLPIQNRQWVGAVYWSSRIDESRRRSWGCLNSLVVFSINLSMVRTVFNLDHLIFLFWILAASPYHVVCFLEWRREKKIKNSRGGELIVVVLSILSIAVESVSLRTSVVLLF